MITGKYKDNSILTCLVWSGVGSWYWVGDMIIVTIAIIIGINGSLAIHWGLV